MSDMSDARDGMKTVLEAHDSKLRVYTYPPDEGVNEKPALVLELDITQGDDTEYQMVAMGGDAINYELVGTLYLQGGRSDEQWAELDKYRSPTGGQSINAGIKTDTTLNNKVDSACVVSSGDIQRNRDGSGPWEYSAQFTFDIIQSN